MKIFFKYIWVKLTGRNFQVHIDFDDLNAVSITKEKLKDYEIANYSQVKRYIHLN